MDDRTAGPLRLVNQELASCVSCGLCLPHCPTYRVTGDEARSPRGRISLMRAVEEARSPLDEEFIDAVDTCVQCRGCETACPSNVPFGKLMTDTRSSLAAARSDYQPWWRRLGYRLLGRHRLLLFASSLLAVVQRAGVVPYKRLGLPRRLPISRPKLRASGTDVTLFTGCVMDAWQREVHVATVTVLEASGAGVGLFPSSAGCCGALHEHAGLSDEARRLAARVVEEAPPGPILVNSAGCGAALKDYGRLLDTPDATAFAARVVDVHEWIAEHGEPLDTAEGPKPVVAVQDPCHLRHVQGSHEPVRTVLRRVADVVELDDEGLCCGAGGAFSVLQPELAGAIASRKIASIERSGAPVVASANPGCTLHLSNRGVAARHPLEVVAERLRHHPDRSLDGAEEHIHGG